MTKDRPDSMEKLYLHTLKDIYYAEKQIVKALPKMIEKASAEPLRSAFEAHLEETKEHVSRLEEVFSLLDEKARGEECPAIEGLIEEAEELAKEISDEETLDAALAAAAQAVEHYEMSRYGSLVAWSEELGRSDCGKLLQKTLDEEKAADRKLTKIAESRLNKAA